jgi:hypothetical protein
VGAPTFVHVRLPDGLSIDLPSDWRLATESSNDDLFRWSQKVLDLADVPSGPGGVHIRAYPPAGEAAASITVSVIRRPAASQQAVAELSGARLARVNDQYYQDLLAGMRAEPATMLQWAGAEKMRLRNAYSLVARYTYSTRDKHPMLMESHRVFLGGGSVGLMLQASADSGDRWWPTLRRVRDSFTASELAPSPR